MIHQNTDKRVENWKLFVLANMEHIFLKKIMYMSNTVFGVNKQKHWKGFLKTKSGNEKSEDA